MLSHQASCLLMMWWDLDFFLFILDFHEWKLSCVRSVCLWVFLSCSFCNQTVRQQDNNTNKLVTRLCFYQTRSAWSVDQGSNKNHSPAYNFTPTVTKFCVMWEGLSLPHDTKFGNCRCKIVDSRSFYSWSLIHGLRWSGLIKVGPGWHALCYEVDWMRTVFQEIPALIIFPFNLMKLPSRQYCRTSLIRSQKLLSMVRLWLGAIKQQAIAGIWTEVDEVLWCHSPSSGPILGPLS